MPSEDRIDSKANVWLGEEGMGVRTGAAADTPKPRKRERLMAAPLQRLARRLGVSPDSLAEKIPEDTIRRLKYPALEQVAEDGTRVFEHDSGIQDDRAISLPRL